MKVEKGQVWSSINRTEFRVLEIVDVEDNTWVHYINTKTGQEHSCYKDSFLARFTPIANQG